MSPAAVYKADLKDSTYNKECAVSAKLEIQGNVKDWAASKRTLPQAILTSPVFVYER